jgi:magnesium transporter
VIDEGKQDELKPIHLLIEQKDFKGAADLLQKYHNVDIAHIIDQYEAEDIFALINKFPVDDQAEIFSYLPHTMQLDLAEELSRRTMTTVLKNMSPDDRADFFNELPERKRELLLSALAKAERDDIRKLSSYEEGSTGSIMTSDYVTFTPHLTCGQALASLRRQADDKETIYNSYVIDENRHLLGTVALDDLILASPETKLVDLMDTQIVVAVASDSKEETARKVAKYDLLAIPVVDAEQKLIGIVTYDDAMDVSEDEATEDFHKGATIGKLMGRVRDASLFHLYRKRVFWLVLLVFGNIFSGAGIAFFEDVIAANIALVFFLPLLIDSGGNAGSQSATLMVRALATGDVVMRDWGKMIVREVFVAFALGLTMAFAVFWMGVYRGGPAIAVVVALTMVLTVMMGSLIGMSLPFILSRLKLDPAAASAPLVTSIADILGVLIYFGLAASMLTFVVN